MGLFDWWRGSAKPALPQPGDSVLAWRPFDDEYRPGEIVAAKGDWCEVRFQDGPVAWIPLVKVKLEPAANSRPAARKPAAAPAAQETRYGVWAIGDRVLSRWFDLYWYPGTIMAIEGEGVRILFDDGDQRTVDDARLMPLLAEVGEAVYARPKSHPVLQYFPAVITRVDGEALDLEYTDDRVEQLVPDRVELLSSVSRVRFWRSPAGDQAMACGEGDRVWAHDLDEFWYPATINLVEGDRIFVHFLHGPERLVTPERIRPFHFRIGMAVECRFRGGPQFFPGRVSRIQGEQIQVDYDDGDKEQTLLRLVRTTSVT